MSDSGAEPAESSSTLRHGLNHIQHLCSHRIREAQDQELPQEETAEVLSDREIWEGEGQEAEIYSQKESSTRASSCIRKRSLATYYIPGLDWFTTNPGPEYEGVDCSSLKRPVPWLTIWRRWSLSISPITLHPPSASKSDDIIQDEAIFGVN